MSPLRVSIAGRPGSPDQAEAKNTARSVALRHGCTVMENEGPASLLADLVIAVGEGINIPDNAVGVTVHEDGTITWTGHTDA